MVPSSVSKLAEELVAARRQGLQLDPTRAQLFPETVAQAYEVQARAAALRDEAVVAYKIGLTSDAAQQFMGAAEPIAGRLTLSDLRASPAFVTVGTHLRIVEAEIVFRIERELPAGSAPFTEEELARCVGEIFAGIEICNSRFPDQGETLRRIVADNSNADLLVVGERLQGCRMEDLADLPVTLTRSGGADVMGTTAKVLGHPLKALTWLANFLAANGGGLRPGQLVATGSCTGMTEVGYGEEVVATFGAMGRASMKFISANAMEGLQE